MITLGEWLFWFLPLFFGLFTLLAWPKKTSFGLSKKDWDIMSLIGAAIIYLSILFLQRGILTARGTNFLVLYLAGCAVALFSTFGGRSTYAVLSQGALVYLTMMNMLFPRAAELLVWILPLCLGLITMVVWPKEPKYEGHVWSFLAIVGAFIVFVSILMVQRGVVSAESLTFQGLYLFGGIVAVFSTLGKSISFAVMVESSLVYLTLLSLFFG